MMALALGWLLAQPCEAAHTWCWSGADVPCRIVSQGRDGQGLERVEVEEDVPGPLPADRAAAVWIVYPGFGPFPAAVGAFRYEVATPHGTFRLCVLPSVAARQRGTSGPPLEGGLALLTFDPSRAAPPRFPLDPAFDTARAEGLLSAVQLRTLDELQRLAAYRAEDLSRLWREFAQSPYLGYSRRQLFEAIQRYEDPQPAGSKDDLSPARFFHREQRMALRRHGHEIPGRCSLLFLPRSARVELAACPLSQLAAAWNRRTVEGGLPNLRARPDREDDEIDGVTLDLADTPPEAAARIVFGLLSAVDGLASTGEAARP